MNTKKPEVNLIDHFAEAKDTSVLQKGILFYLLIENSFDISDLRLDHFSGSCRRQAFKKILEFKAKKKPFNVTIISNELKGKEDKKEVSEFCDGVPVGKSKEKTLKYFNQLKQELIDIFNEFECRKSIEQINKKSDSIQSIWEIANNYLSSKTKGDRPEFETLYDFFQRDIPERKILVDPILGNQEIIMLHGIPKIGKTLTILNLAKSLVSGESWLDFNIPEPIYPILIIQTEVADALFKIRVENMFSDPKLAKRIVIPRQSRRLYLTEKSGRNVIASLIQDIKPKAVFLDPYEKFFPDEEMSFKNPRPFFDFFQEQIDLHKFMLLYVHHDGKYQEGKIGGQRALGSTIISSSTDSNWNLRRILDKGLTPEDFNRTVELSFESRNWQPMKPLTLRLNDNFQFNAISLPKSSVTEWDLVSEIENAGGQIEQKELIKMYSSVDLFYKAKNKAMNLGLIDEVKLETKGNPRLLILK